MVGSKDELGVGGTIHACSFLRFANGLLDQRSSIAVLLSTSEPFRHEFDECMVKYAYAYLAFQRPRAEVAYAKLLRARVFFLTLSYMTIGIF